MVTVLPFSPTSNSTTGTTLLSTDSLYRRQFWVFPSQSLEDIPTCVPPNILPLVIESVHGPSHREGFVYPVFEDVSSGKVWSGIHREVHREQRSTPRNRKFYRKIYLTNYIHSQRTVRYSVRSFSQFGLPPKTLGTKYQSLNRCVRFIRPRTLTVVFTLPLSALLTRQLNALDFNRGPSITVLTQSPMGRPQVLSWLTNEQKPLFRGCKVASSEDTTINNPTFLSSFF